MRTTRLVMLAVLAGGGACSDDSSPAKDSRPLADLGQHMDGADSAVPDTLQPDTSRPDAAEQDTQPDAVETDALAPDTLAPDTIAPDALAPDTLAHDTLAPDTLAPDALASDTLAPDTLAPDTLAPDTLAASYCDVLYRVSGTFKTTDAPIVGQFTKSVGANAALPPFDPARTTPFTPTAFPDGFIRLRFPNLGGAPAAGPVQVVEYYMPMEFSVTTFGTTVNTDVDHSAGMLQLSSAAPPVIGDPPALSRGCAPVASGTLSGTTLAWDSCSAAPDDSTTWTFAKAQSGDPGCLSRMSVWGHVNCTSGFCGMVTGLGNQRATWDQLLNSFQFSGTDLSTATFTMAEVQTPNTTGVKTYIAIAATSVVKIECDAAGPVACDEQ